MPLKEQVTVNQRNGRNERIFVNLEAVYPTPEINGSELSFEELRASSRGWLGKLWKSDKVDQFALDKPTVDFAGSSLSTELSEKLVIEKDIVLLDENGAVVDRPPRPKRVKTMEVNETQISKIHLCRRDFRANSTSKNEAFIALRKKAVETKGGRRSHHDFPYQSRNRRYL